MICTPVKLASTTSYAGGTSTLLLGKYLDSKPQAYAVFVSVTLTFMSDNFYVSLVSHFIKY